MPENATTQTLIINHREPVVLENAAGAQIDVLQGQLWLTQAGDGRDIVLRPSQHFDVTLPASIVMTGMGPAEVRVSWPTPAPVKPAFSLTAWLGAWIAAHWHKEADPFPSVGLRRLRLG